VDERSQLSRAKPLFGVLLGSLLFVSSANSAEAATTVVCQKANGRIATYYRDGERIRLENAERASGASAVLIDAHAKRTFLIYDDDRAFFDLDRGLRKARRQVGREREAAARREATTSVYLPSHENRTIDDIPCVMYQRLDNGSVSEEICAASWGPKVGQPEDAGWAEAISGRWLDDLVADRAATASAKSRPPGMPLWMSPINPDRTRGDEIEVKSLRFGALPASLFAVPAGYTELDHPLAARQERPPVRAEVAPAPAPTSATPAAPPRVGLSGLVVILVLGLAMVGLFINALFLHVAATFVLEEPRFINAIVALLLAWIASVPLALLRVWWPIDLVVGLLANYGGLRLAYGASRGRTIGLMFVSMLVMVAFALVVVFPLALLGGTTHR
jgi:hypothetical protein